MKFPVVREKTGGNQRFLKLVVQCLITYVPLASGFNLGSRSVAGGGQYEAKDRRCVQLPGLYTTIDDVYILLFYYFSEFRWTGWNSVLGSPAEIQVWQLVSCTFLNTCVFI